MIERPRLLHISFRFSDIFVIELRESGVFERCGVFSILLYGFIYIPPCWCNYHSGYTVKPYDHVQ